MLLVVNLKPGLVITFRTPNLRLKRLGVILFVIILHNHLSSKNIPNIIIGSNSNFTSLKEREIL